MPRAEPGKSYELWVISDRLGAPRSLGVIGEGDFTARPTLASYDNEHRQECDLCGDGRTVRRFARTASRPRRRCSPAS